MKPVIESYIDRASTWPASCDDSDIDDLIWSEISSSLSAGDFACYLVHRLQGARRVDAAKARYELLDDGGETTPAGYLRAIRRIRELADGDDAGAMFHLGKVYSIGIAVEQNFSLAERWYLKAIAHGEVRAHCNLGWLYQSGFGVPENKEKAFALLSTGARQGVLAAATSVGLMMLSGEGCQASPAEGIGMLEEAFHGGYNNAANCLADTYFAGRYIPQNTDLGFDWLERVVVRGDDRSMAILGHFLVTGSHGRTDVARGVAYLFGAVNRGFLPAHLWLGALYERGLGIERNPHMARMLFEKGAAAGDEECEFALARLRSGAVLPPVSSPALIN